MSRVKSIRRLYSIDFAQLWIITSPIPRNLLFTSLESQTRLQKNTVKDYVVIILHGVFSKDRLHEKCNINYHRNATVNKHRLGERYKKTFDNSSERKSKVRNIYKQICNNLGLRRKLHTLVTFTIPHRNIFPVYVIIYRHTFTCAKIRRDHEIARIRCSIANFPLSAETILALQDRRDRATFKSACLACPKLDHLADEGRVDERL